MERPFPQGCFLSVKSAPHCSVQGPFPWQSVSRSGREEEGKQGQHNQEAEIEGRVQQQVIPGFAGVMRGIGAEGNQRSQRGNQGAGTADVDAKQQAAVVPGEM